MGRAPMSSTVGHAANPRLVASARYVGGSRYVHIALYATVVTFYAASVYRYDIAQVLTAVKWIPLIALFLFSLQVAARRGLIANIGFGWIFAFMVPILTGIIVSSDIGRSLAFALGLLLVILTSSMVAILSKDDVGAGPLFEAYANIGRLFIALSAVTYVLNMNLGRGGVEARFSGWTDNPNTLALLISPCIVVLIARCIERRRGWLWKDATCLAAGLVLLLATGSRASFLWVVASVGFLLFGRKLSPVTLVFALCSIALVFLFKQQIELTVSIILNREASLESADVLSGRTEIWDLAYSLYQERPVLGYGLGMEEVLVRENSWKAAIFQGGHFHNSFISLLIEVGLFGIVVICGILLHLLVSGYGALQKKHNITLRKSVQEALPLAIVVGALSHAAFETWLFSPGNPQVLLFWICMWSFAVRGGRIKNPNPSMRAFR